MIEEVLRKLTEGTSPSAVEVSHLAGLTSADLPALRGGWVALASERRRAILGIAIQLAEDDVQVDFATLFRMCLKDSDAAVRAKAVEGLWEDEEFRTADVMAILLRQDVDEAVRIAAAMGLARFAVLAEVGSLYQPSATRVRDALLAAVQDSAESLEVQRRALESLGAFDNDTVAGLILLAYNHPAEKMRASAVYAMGRSADERWLPTILRELDSESDEIRFEAIRAAGALENPRAVVPLIAVLDDPDSEIRLAAIGSLGEIGGDVARRALERCATGQDPAMRDAAIEALQELDLGDDPLTVRPFTDTSDSST